MRHSYTPIFRDVINSRVWALSPAARAVWLWLHLVADPEGCICADVTGVAVGARVTGPEAREALELLGLVDADADAEDPFQGRIIERMRGGWRVLAFESLRELAKVEARNARNRKYMQRARTAAANDVDGCVPTVSPPKPKPKPKPSEEGNPPTPLALVESVMLAKEAMVNDVAGDSPAHAASRIVPPSVVYAIPATWQPSQSLRGDATMAGVANLDERVASLRSGPIGGTRGVFEDALDDYVRTFFGKWRTWDETDRAKAAVAASKPRGQSYRDRPEDTLTTTQAASAFRPSADHERFCNKHDLDLTHAVKLYRQSPEHDKVGFAESERRFLERLKCWAVTGTFHPDGPLPKARRAEREGAAA